MLAKYEKRLPDSDENIWVARWVNLKNSAHWHDETEIVFCENGKIEIETEKEKFCLNSGECALLLGGEIHKIYSESDAVCITALISATVASEITAKYSLKEKKLVFSYDIQAFYNKIKAIMREKGDLYKIAAKAQTTLLLAEIFSKEQKSAVIKSERNGRYALLKDILNVIETDYVYITFDDVCRRFGYSSAHFSRLFTQLTGTNFTKYLTSVKISHAVELLQSDDRQSVTNVATACGFSSIRNFNRYFKLLTGYTPRELPKGFYLSYGALKRRDEPFDPTSKTSILLD